MTSPRAHPWLSLIGVLALCACSLAPDYHVPLTPISASQFKEWGTWNKAVPEDQLPKGAWWAVFEDRQLAKLEAKLDTSNPTLAAALARYDQARAFAAEARSNEYPLLGTDNSFSQNRQSDNRPLRGSKQPDWYGANTVGLSVNYELDIWGSIRNQVEAGKAEAQEQSALAEFARLSLETDLANNYFALRQSDAQLKLLNQTVAAYGRALLMTRQRHEGGVVSGLDVGRAQTQLYDARAQLSQAEAQRALYEHAIASLVGVSASDFSLPSLVTPIKVPNVPTALPATLVQRRPDVAAAERRVAAANAEIGVARAAFFPQITLGTSGGFQNTGQAGLLTAPNLFWSIGPSIAMTLFDAGQHQAQLDISKAEYQQVADAYRAQVLQAFQDVEDNLALLNHLALAENDEDNAADAAERTESLSLARYQLGAVNYLDVVTAQAASLSTQLGQLQIKTRRLQAAVRLIKAIGGGWTRGDMPTGSEPFDSPVHVAATKDAP